MKLSISKKTLEKHLENVSRVIQQTNVLPSLTGILITANESNIQFVVSNGNLSIKETIEFDELTRVEEAGKILVPGVLFKNLIKKQSNEISLNSDLNNLVVDSNGFKTVINLLNPSDYPVFSFESIGQEMIIDSENFEKIIKNVSFASSENDKRLILNGVNLVASNGKLTATATNSFRLAQESTPIKNNIDFNITIFSKNLKDFLPLGVNGELSIKVDDNKIVTSYKSSVVVSKMIEGNFPDVTKLIPQNPELELKINTKALNDLIDKATVVSEETLKVVRLTINDNELIIESKKKEIGEAFVKTTEFTASTKKFQIAFNATFLKDAASRFSGDITIGFSGEFKAFVIKSDSNPDLIQLILPHRSF